MNPPRKLNAVAAIRVSTGKQGTDGDSPEDQSEQIARFAGYRNMTVVDEIILLESASKKIQPMDKALDYCKNSKHKIDVLLFKSIDRFTRGGSEVYGRLKREFAEMGIEIMDVHGTISGQQVNTLEHLGFEYSWSKRNLSLKSEILEAERSREEIETIMTRTIGAEIRYTQLGYWMRRPPYGYDHVRTETPHGKRNLLYPNKDEAPMIEKIFKLRAERIMTDVQIVEHINKLGFATRKEFWRDTNGVEVIGEKGGKPLYLKQLLRIIENPIYAGIVYENWTHFKPIKHPTPGIASIELYNTANRGKRIITKNVEDDYELHEHKDDTFKQAYGKHNDEFPYRKFILCPTCEKPLVGSSSRGRLGKYYPAYHCHRGHYFRVPKAEFEATINAFIRSIKVDSKNLDEILAFISAEQDNRLESQKTDQDAYKQRIDVIESKIRATVSKMALINSETALKYMEEDIMKMEQEIKELRKSASEELPENSENMTEILMYVKYFVEHLGELTINRGSQAEQVRFLGILFDKQPTFDIFKSGTQKTAQLPEVNELFRVMNNKKGHLAPGAGFEPATN